MHTQIIIKITKDISIQNLISLYKEAGWWADKDNQISEKNLHNLVQNSFCFAGAFFENKLIGMGRCLSDGVSDAYIQDVVVLNKYRKIGIGKRIIKKITEYLIKKKILWIGIIAEPNTSDFYTKLGFKKLKNYTPMLFKI
jgi:ribosomal protein S18 acetylase RimI-like enzyme